MNVLISVLATTLSAATPLIFASQGALYSERSGVINIALEGIMLISAFSAVAFTSLTGSVWYGLLLTLFVGALLGLLHATATVSFKCDHVVSGVGINLFGLGITAVLMQAVFGVAGSSPRVPTIPVLELPILRAIPVLGNQNLLVYVALATVGLSWYFMHRTRWGLRLKAVGEHPKAAETVGISVKKYRYLAVIASGVITSLGGAYLSLGPLGFFVEGMTVGKGFIALAANIFGNWTPIGAFLASLLFGFFDALQIQLQVWDFGVPSQLVRSLPYVLTIIALIGGVVRSRPPAAVGTHYE